MSAPLEISIVSSLFIHIGMEVHRVFSEQCVFSKSIELLYEKHPTAESYGQIG